MTFDILFSYKHLFCLIKELLAQFDKPAVVILQNVKFSHLKLLVEVKCPNIYHFSAELIHHYFPLFSTFIKVKSLCQLASLIHF